MRRGDWSAGACRFVMSANVLTRKEMGQKERCSGSVSELRRSANAWEAGAANTVRSFVVRARSAGGWPSSIRAFPISRIGCGIGPNVPTLQGAGATAIRPQEVLRLRDRRRKDFNLNKRKNMHTKIEKGVTSGLIGGDAWVTFSSGSRRVRILREDIGAWVSQGGRLEIVAGINLSLMELLESDLIEVLNQTAAPDR